MSASGGSTGSAAKSGSTSAGATAKAGSSAAAGMPSGAAAVSGGGTAGITAAGSAGAAGARAGAGGAATAGSGTSAGQNAAGMAATAPQQCHGKQLPPRALGADPPFDVGPKAAGLPEYWPTDDWRTELPDKLGFDPAKLMAAADFSTSHSHTQAVLIVRHGYIALEKYAAGFSASQQHESYSMAKSFSSGLVGIAMAEGMLKSTDDKICESYPMQWDCSDMSDPRSRITVAHAMNLTTGLKWSEDWRSTKVGQTNDAYNPNLLDTVLAREAVEEPGVHKRYSTGDPALLSGVLQRATGMTAYAYAKAKIFDVIGIPACAGTATAMAGPPPTPGCKRARVCEVRLFVPATWSVGRQAGDPERVHRSHHPGQGPL
jgi:hypothetical protein